LKGGEDPLILTLFLGKQRGIRKTPKRPIPLSPPSRRGILGKASINLPLDSCSPFLNPWPSVLA